MSKKTITAVVGLAIIILSPIANAAEGVVGEWAFKSLMPARSSTATMTIKKNAEGKYEGAWLQSGESVLSDITFDNGKLKFVQTSSFGVQETKTRYEGTVVDGKITGKAHSQLGDFTFEGTLREETKTGADAIAGEWEMNVTMPAREIIEKLIITKNASGTLAGKWDAQMGENTISNVKFEAGKLTFTRTSKFRDREFTMTFEGIVEGDNIKGVFKSERGEWPMNATRITAAKAGEVKKPVEVKKAEPKKPAGEKKN
ncbi:MAG: hypothetical protein WC454_01405 [Phycisphaerae bacterium]|jgi:hypothetical protein